MVKREREREVMNNYFKHMIIKYQAVNSTKASVSFMDDRIFIESILAYDLQGACSVSLSFILLIHLFFHENKKSDG